MDTQSKQHTEKPKQNWRTQQVGESVFTRIGPRARQEDETTFQYVERQRREKRILKASLKGVYLVKHEKKKKA